MPNMKELCHNLFYPWRQWMAFTALLLFSGCLVDQIGGAFTQRPEDLDEKASVGRILFTQRPV